MIKTPFYFRKTAFCFLLKIRELYSVIDIRFFLLLLFVENAVFLLSEDTL